MTGAAADVTVFHPDLYLAAAAAIPVLWVATGFATTATAAILRGLQSLGSTVKITSPYGLLRVTVSPQSSTVSFLGATVGVAGLGLSEAMAFWFVALLVVPGAAGEIGSLWALKSRTVAPWVSTMVFVCTCVVVAITVLVIVISLLAGLAEANRSRGAPTAGVGVAALAVRERPPGRAARRRPVLGPRGTAGRPGGAPAARPRQRPG